MKTKSALGFLLPVLLLVSIASAGPGFAQTDNDVDLRLIEVSPSVIELQWVGGKGQFEIFRARAAQGLRTETNRVDAVRGRKFRDADTLPMEPLVFYSVEDTRLCGNGLRDMPLETCDPPGDPARDSASGEICRDDCTFCFDGVSSEDDCSPLLVVLRSFTAEWTKDGVLVRWSTASEINNVGFRLLRGHQAPSGRERLELLTPQVIPPAGTELYGADYEFLDESAQPGSVLYYYLEDIDLLGGVTRHPPVVLGIPE